MGIWLYIFLLVLHLFSFLSAVLTFKNMNHVMRGHVHTIGEEHKNLIISPRIKLAKIIYFGSLIGVAIISFVIYGL